VGRVLDLNICPSLRPLRHGADRTAQAQGHTYGDWVAESGWPGRPAAWMPGKIWGKSTARVWGRRACPVREASANLGRFGYALGVEIRASVPRDWMTAVPRSENRPLSQLGLCWPLTVRGRIAFTSAAASHRVG
jgi:hypothetical protein